MAVPVHMLGMRFVLAPRLLMSAPLMQTLHDVWIHIHTKMPLYAVRLIRSHFRLGSIVRITHLYSPTTVYFRST